ncbi:MAG: hypothetical protein FWE67_03725 [Planctomycetaceae bacterium]|nr:hypothetical protein [Planctomycetaceae bacterium]
MNEFTARRIFRVILAAVFFSAVFCHVQAQVPDFLRKLVPGNRHVEADPKKEYTVTETNGPWMIHVCSFSGQKGREQANSLVYELRKDYKLKAYFYNHTFVSDTRLEKDLKRNPYSKTRPQYNKKGKIDEYAVLIGDFQTVDDLELQKILKDIRQVYPECMKQFPGQQIPKGTPSPFQMCFAVTNPLLNSGYFKQSGVVDDFVAKLNDQRPYSLLNCPGRYTVQIATFTGRIEIKQNKIEEILDGRREFLDNGKSELELAEKAAVKLCKILRDKGYDAYEFHDRYSSIVTIGAFDSYGQRQPNGMMDYHPQVAALLRDFQARPARQDAMTANTVNFEPVKFEGIECDAQPRIIEVPRKRR